MIVERDHADAIGDDELTRLALAADPDQPVDPDAVPISFAAAAIRGRCPVVHAGSDVVRARTSARMLLGGLVLALVVINAAGLCVTYGIPEIAW